MRRAQAAVELAILMSLIMLTLFIIFDFSMNRLTQDNSMLQVSQARNTVDRLAKAVTDVHNEGVGARRSIYVQIPDRVNSGRITINNTRITIGVYAPNGTTDVTAPTDFPVVESTSFPTTPGSYWVWVISRQNYVQIGSSFSVDPSTVYLELFPTNLTSANITLTNLGTSTLNVTANLTWSDSEVSAAINGSSGMNFLFSSGTYSSVLINFSTNASSNASFGFHSGYINITTNVSENETIPVMVNVVSLPQALQTVSYLTLDTYNDSSYLYSNATFTRSTTLYYRVKSYNSTNDRINSTVTVRIYDTSSNLVSEQTPSLGITGTYTGSYAIASDAPLGSWRINAYDISGVNTATYFTVNS